MRKDYDEPIRWDRWGFRNPAACFETLPSSRGGVSKHATETTGARATFVVPRTFSRITIGTPAITIHRSVTRSYRDRRAYTNSEGMVLGPGARQVLQDVQHPDPQGLKLQASSSSGTLDLASRQPTSKQRLIHHFHRRIHEKWGTYYTAAVSELLLVGRQLTAHERDFERDSDPPHVRSTTGCCHA